MLLCECTPACAPIVKQPDTHANQPGSQPPFRLHVCPASLPHAPHQPGMRTPPGVHSGAVCAPAWSLSPNQAGGVCCAMLAPVITAPTFVTVHYQDGCPSLSQQLEVSTTGYLVLLSSCCHNCIDMRSSEIMQEALAMHHVVWGCTIEIHCMVVVP